MKKTIQFFCLLLFGLFLFNSCKKKEDVCNENIGPVSCSDFRSITPPTYEQVIKCYDDAVAVNPQQNDLDLAHSIFNCIKLAPVQNPPAKPLFDLQSRMCVEEWKLVLLYPRKAYLAFKNGVNQSLERAKQEFPQDIDVEFKNAKAHAFRNAYLSVLVTKATDTSFARQLAFARQSCLQNRIYLHNDTVGIGLVRRFPAANITELINLLLERRYYFSDGVPADAENALVFFAGRRTYDATYAGTFTNPDGQGNWNTTYYFHQTGNIIRGEARYTGIGFPDKANRRYSGTVSGNTINLNVSNPYAFEFSPGYTPCRNMKTTFAVEQDSLSGNWTASNCFQGGVIKLKKQ
jgi:hypothetical protein